MLNSAMIIEPMPAFESEEEEALWWDAHPEAITGRFTAAKKKSGARRLSQTNLPGASEVTKGILP